MERLLTRANEINAELGISTDYQIDSYADIVAAIHLVQTEIGITGTTAKEAATTIQGSVAAAKSAWSNLVTGIADENADLDTLIGNFVDSVATAGENIIPRVEQILTGMGSAIQKLAPVIGEQLPPLIQSVLPSLLSAGGELLNGLVNGIITAAPSLIETGVPMIASLASGLASALPQILSSAGNIIMTLMTGITASAPSLVSSAFEIVTSLINGISEQLPLLIPAAFDMILELVTSLTDPDNLGNLVDAALNLILSLADGLIEWLPKLREKGPIIIKNLYTALVESTPKILSAALELITALGAGLVEYAVNLPGSIWNVITAIYDGFIDGVDRIKEAGAQLLTGLWNGITDKIEWLKGKVSGVVDTIKSWFTGEEGFDEHSPSKWSRGVAAFVMDGLALGFLDGEGKVMQTIEDIVGEAKNRFEEAKNFFSGKSEVSELEYELWERTDGRGVPDMMKYQKKLEMLTAQQEDQASVVEAAQAAYEAIVKQYGSASEESYKLQKTLLEEKLVYQDLLDAITQVNNAKHQAFIKQEAQRFETGHIDFQDSAIGVSSAALINTYSQAQNPYQASVSLNAKLVTADGKELAQFVGEPLVSLMDSNGTPIDLKSGTR